MANNKKKNLNTTKELKIVETVEEANNMIEAQEPIKKKRGNPNLIKKQNEIIEDVKENKEEIIEEVSSNQIINNSNENNNIVITDDDCNNNSHNTNENLDNTCTSQKIGNKKVKKNSSLYKLLSRPSGATMEELEKELNWKKASIRGTISNLQKQQQFCLITINVIKPNLDNKSFYKETRYFIKDCEFNLFNDLFNQ